MTVDPGSPAWGFTLVELLVTIAVFAILVGVAVPSFMQALASVRVTSVTNDILTALTVARSEAIRRNQRVTACTSADAAACAGGGSSWSGGWIVFVDRDRDAAVDNGEPIVQSGPAAGADTTIVGTANVAQYVSFAPDGTPKLTSGAVQTGTLRICSSATALTDIQRVRDIRITAAGRLAAETPAGGVGSACPAP